VLSQGPAQAQTPAAAELVESAKLGQLPRLKDLLSAGTPPEATDSRGFTPLMWASAAGHIDMVRLLLDNKASPTRRATDGTTALMLAAANGFSDVARALIARGADVRAVRGGSTARQLAANRGFSQTAALLEQSERLGSQLMQAAKDGNDGLVRQMLVLGASVNETDERRTTPLMLAARGGNLGMVQFLLLRGADPSARDADGLSAFNWGELSAATGKYVVAFFLDQGVSRDAPRETGPRPSPPVSTSLLALETLIARVPSVSGPLGAARQRARGVLAQLIELSGAWPAQSPEDYRANLAAEVDALRAGLDTGDAAAVTATLQSVSDDLEAKLEHCNRSGGKLGGSVAVRVRTLQGDQEIKSWQVFYMPKVFEATKNAGADLFPLLSSPTEDTLVPGRYLMWVRNPVTSRLGERTVVKVGEGKKDLLVELPVPADPPR
jgi:ankyrin repeat protein